MAATPALTDLITPTNLAPGTIGDHDHRSTPLQRVTFEASFDHYRDVRHFVQFAGDAWTEPCGRCGGEGNVHYGPHGGLCYGCNGGGLGGPVYRQDELDAMLLKWARGIARKSAANGKRIAAAAVKADAWRAAHQDLIVWANTLIPTEMRVVDSYDRRDADRAVAETPHVPGDRLIRSEATEDGQWWAAFSVEEPYFEEFKGKADTLICRVRRGGTPDAKETAYLTKVMESAIREAAERAQLAAAARHAGPVGTRMEITGTIIFIMDLEPGRFGAARWLLMEGTGQDAGITWKMSTGAKAVWSLHKGDTVRVTGTIREHEEYRGVKGDNIGRPILIRVDEDDEQDEAPTAPAAPAPQPEPAPQPHPETAPQAAAPAPAAPSARPKARRSSRATLGPSAVADWGLLYDKPRHNAQVGRNDNGDYAMLCTVHKTVTPLARLTDERTLRSQGGWCCH